MPEIRIENEVVTLETVMRVCAVLLSRKEKRTNPRAEMRLARLIAKASQIDQLTHTPS